MFRLETIIEMIVDILRSVLAEAFSGRIAEMRPRFRRGPRGMAEVRRHVHRQCRRRLLNRLSTPQ